MEVPQLVLPPPPPESLPPFVNDSGNQAQFDYVAAQSRQAALFTTDSTLQKQRNAYLTVLIG